MVVSPKTLTGSRLCDQLIEILTIHIIIIDLIDLLVTKKLLVRIITISPPEYLVGLGKQVLLSSKVISRTSNSTPPT